MKRRTIQIICWVLAGLMLFGAAFAIIAMVL